MSYCLLRYRCEKSIYKFKNQVYKGFHDLDSAILFLADSFTCQTVPIYDDVGHIKTIKQFNHSCEICTSDHNNNTDKSVNRSDHHQDSLVISDQSDASNSEYHDAYAADCSDDETMIKALEEHTESDENTEVKLLYMTKDSNNENTYELKMKSCLMECGTLDNTDMLECSKCSGWIHYTCAELSQYQLYTLITSSRKFTCVPSDYQFVPTKSTVPLHADMACQTETQIPSMMEATENKILSYIDMLANRFQQTLVQSLSGIVREEPQWKEEISLLQQKIDDKETIFNSNIDKIKKEMSEINIGIKELNNKALTTKMCVKQDEKLKEEIHLIGGKIEKLSSKVQMCNTNECSTQDCSIKSEMSQIKNNIEELNRKTPIISPCSVHNSQIENDISNIKDSLEELYNKTPCSYACQVQNKFDPLNDAISTDSQYVNETEDSNKNTDFKSKSNDKQKQQKLSNANFDKQTQNKNVQDVQSKCKKVLLMGNSHLKPVRMNNFLQDCYVSKFVCYTLSDADKYINELRGDYDCIFIHLFTNDIDRNSPENVCSEFESLIHKIHSKWPALKVVISLGISRGDSEILNEKIATTNVILQHSLLSYDYVTVCDNASLSIHSLPNGKFLVNDNVHLNEQGTSVFVSNIKFSMKKALGLKSINAPQNQYREYKDSGRSKNNPYYNQSDRYEGNDRFRQNGYNSGSSNHYGVGRHRNEYIDRPRYSTAHQDYYPRYNRQYRRGKQYYPRYYDQNWDDHQ